MNFIGDITLYIRTGLYLLMAIEFLFLAQLYWYGYKRVKQSRIIFILQRLLLSLGVLFLCTAFLLIAKSLTHPLYEVVLLFYPFLLFPTLYYLRRFRKESIGDQDILLPKDIKVKKDKLL